LGLFGGNFPDLEEADPSQAAKKLPDLTQIIQTFGLDQSLINLLGFCLTFCLKNFLNFLANPFENQKIHKNFFERRKSFSL